MVVGRTIRTLVWWIFHEAISGRWVYGCPRQTEDVDEYSALNALNGSELSHRLAKVEKNIKFKALFVYCFVFWIPETGSLVLIRDPHLLSEPTLVRAECLFMIFMTIWL